MTELATDRPVLLVFAGANGSGKSTVTDEFRRIPTFPRIYINADAIAREPKYAIIPAAFGARNLFAANEAERRRQAAIDSKEPFSFETVLSTIGKLAVFDQAKAAGYNIQLVIVMTSDASINQVRVANRVAAGGHDVDFNKIAERYDRTMKLLPSAIDRADSALVFDNSVDGQAPVLVARKREGQSSVTVEAFTAPLWVAKHIMIPMAVRQASVDTLKRQAEGMTPNMKLDAAQLHGSKVYSGLVIGSTAEHTLQRQNTSDHFILHDKRLTHPSQYLISGQAAAIAYRFGADGKHKMPPVRQAASPRVRR